MSTTRQHIEDLDRDAWATLTHRAASQAVAAARRRGKTPPAEVTTLASMSERDLADHRDRFGPGHPHLSPTMRLVQADQLRVTAERQARQAEQDKHDAEAAAAMARDDAEEAARAATAARERTRAAEEQAARTDLERTIERAAAQRQLDELRTELNRVRADAAAQSATAREQLAAAEGRAHERIAERAAECAAAQQDIEELHAEVDRIRADAAAEVAAATEQASAAEARAE